MIETKTNVDRKLTKNHLIVMSKTPYRMSFFGGGTDYPEYFRRFGGEVISSSFNKYCRITIRNLPPFFSHKLRLVYSVVEEVRDASEISHPSARAVLEHLNAKSGLEIHHDGDLPARSGIGSSSSFTVGMINALSAFKGTQRSPEELRNTATLLEREKLCEPVGYQDQACAAYGGINRIIFHKDGSVEVVPVSINPSKKKALENNLMLFYTGISRLSSVASSYTINNIPSRQKQLGRIKENVSICRRILEQQDQSIDDFGHLLHANWIEKRQLSSKVSFKKFDEGYAKAIEAGAIGGKLMGAGSGGFCIFYVNKKKQNDVRQALKEFIEVPFRFESKGSHIVTY